MNFGAGQASLSRDKSPRNQPSMSRTHPQFENDEQRAQYLKKLIVKGEKIAAIRYVREREGIGLKAAKDKVDGVIAELNQLPDGHPDKPVRGKGGCGIGVVLIGTLFILLLIATFI